MTPEKEIKKSIEKDVGKNNWDQFDNDEFLKEFSFINNAKSYSLLYKDESDYCENELLKFEEDDKKISEIYAEMKNIEYFDLT